MRLHYFDTGEPDPADWLLCMCKEQGYVPETCLLGGVTAWAETKAGRDPCSGCHGNRSKCGGRPGEYGDNTRGPLSSPGR